MHWFQNVLHDFPSLSIFNIVLFRAASIVIAAQKVTETALDLLGFVLGRHVLTIHRMPPSTAIRRGEILIDVFDELFSGIGASLAHLLQDAVVKGVGHYAVISEVLLVLDGRQ